MVEPESGDADATVVRGEARNEAEVVMSVLGAEEKLSFVGPSKCLGERMLPFNV
jgi:hypothetical protein